MQSKYWVCLKAEATVHVPSVFLLTGQTHCLKHICTIFSPCYCILTEVPSFFTNSPFPLWSSFLDFCFYSVCSPLLLVSGLGSLTFYPWATRPLTLMWSLTPTSKLHPQVRCAFLISLKKTVGCLSFCVYYAHACCLPCCLNHDDIWAVPLSLVTRLKFLLKNRKDTCSVLGLILPFSYRVDLLSRWCMAKMFKAVVT